MPRLCYKSICGFEIIEYGCSGNSAFVQIGFVPVVMARQPSPFRQMCGKKGARHQSKNTHQFLESVILYCAITSDKSIHDEASPDCGMRIWPSLCRLECIVPCVCVCAYMPRNMHIKHNNIVINYVELCRKEVSSEISWSSDCGASECEMPKSQQSLAICRSMAMELIWLGAEIHCINHAIQ